MILRIIDDEGKLLDSCTLEEFVAENEGVLNDDDFATLKRGHLVKVGGGAAPLFFIEAMS